MYQTVLVEGGAVEFRKDFYQRDDDIGRGRPDHAITDGGADATTQRRS